MTDYQQLAAHLPVDRYMSIVTGAELACKSFGVLLFADISGFTPLTETMATELGARVGAEQLTYHLNEIYTAVIARIHAYHGSVIFFSGDAVTCWFGVEGESGTDKRLAAQRAVSAALAIQQAMCGMAEIKVPSGRILPLTIKVAVVGGAVHRFVVGDPNFQRFDMLAGATIDRLAAAEQLAGKGEIVLGAELVEWLGTDCGLTVRPLPAMRLADAPLDRFVLLDGLATIAEPAPWPVPNTSDGLPVEVLREWLLPTVYNRYQSGLGEFLTELRPVVALFLQFSGLDYDNDGSATAKLDAFVRWVQKIVSQYDGSLLQVTVGDKGSYLYCAFGAPLAHQDDCERALQAARLLLQPPTELTWANNLRIGLSQGTMRCGIYGAPDRHTYGVLGDEVNLSARLMQAAGTYQILVSSRIQKAVAAKTTFEWQSLPPLRVKGKAEPVKVFRLEKISQRSLPTGEPAKVHLVGRAAELAVMQAKLATAVRGNGQLIILTGEAGIGKSRLVREFIKEAANIAGTEHLQTLAAACESYATDSPYHVWLPIMQTLFGLDPASPISEQLASLQAQLTGKWGFAPERLSLLPTLLNLPTPVDDSSGDYDPKLRKAALESLVVDIFKMCLAEEPQKPILLVLEDCHWLDLLSYDLVQAVALALSGLPMLIMLTMRPLDEGRLGVTRLAALSDATAITLVALTAGESAEFIRARLAQFDTVLPATPASQNLIAQIQARCEGNPFYIEELLNYLREQGDDWFNPQIWEKLELPDSLHSLILSRLDRLAESEKGVVKVASILGRTFPASWIWGVYPIVGQPEAVKTSLTILERAELALLEKPEPGLEYAFKHGITQEVIYVSQPKISREELHARAGHYIEAEFGTEAENWLDLLVYHYGHSSNRAKQKEYYRKAAEAAKRRFAMPSALEHYRNLLALLAAEEQIPVLLEMVQLEIVTAEWSLAEQHARQALKLSEELADQPRQSLSLRLLGEIYFNTGQYPPSKEYLQASLTIATELGDKLAVSNVLYSLGNLASNSGDYTEAENLYQQSLVLRSELNHPQAIAGTLGSLGTLARNRGDYKAAQAYFEESLALQRAIGHKQNIAVMLTNLAAVLAFQRDYATARRYLEESLALYREIGAKQYLNFPLGRLAQLAADQGDFAAAQNYYEQALTVSRETGNKQGLALALTGLGQLALFQGDYAKAAPFFSESLAINREIGNKPGIAGTLNDLGTLAQNTGDYVSARTYYAETLELVRQLGEKLGTAYTLNNLAVICYLQGDYTAAEAYFAESLERKREMGDQWGSAYSLNGLAILATQAGDYAKAYRLYSESLEIRQAINDKAGLVHTLAALVGLVVNSAAEFPAAFSSAATLLGAVDSLLKTLKIEMLGQPERTVYTEASELVRQQLRLADFEAAYNRGQIMSLIEAGAFAMQLNADSLV